MHTTVHAWICVELDVAQPLPPRIWIRETKENGFWQKLEYEGNNTFCTKCGLLGHVVRVCRKGQPKPKPQAKNNQPENQAANKEKNHVEYRSKKQPAAIPRQIERKTNEVNQTPL